MKGAQSLRIGGREIAPGVAVQDAGTFAQSAATEVTYQAEIAAYSVAGHCAYALDPAAYYADFLADEYQEGGYASAETHPHWAMERKRQAEMLRDIFGPLPFRSVPIEPAWLTRNDGTVAKLAHAIYDESRFEDMPILADALEDAGCHEEQILAHCRGPGPHVRGCWVIDLLLGKE